MTENNDRRKNSHPHPDLAGHPTQNGGNLPQGQLPQPKRIRGEKNNGGIKFKDVLREHDNGGFD